MSITMTEAPALAALVGDIDSALDRTGRTWRGHVRMQATWPAIRDRVGAAMREALAKADLLELLASGWAKAKALEQRAAERLSRDGLTTEVRLASHEQDIKFEPGFALTVNGVAVGRLPLALVLEVAVDGAVLSVRNLEITEVELGKISLSGHLELGGAVTPLALAIPEFNLLGKHPLKQPRRIGEA